ncbi:hypothetical protein GGTG_13578, partial [Gaeumannomyces tritici R3-111a-1]
RSIRTGWTLGNGQGFPLTRYGAISRQRSSLEGVPLDPACRPLDAQKASFPPGSPRGRLCQQLGDRGIKFAGWRDWPHAYVSHPANGAEHFMPLAVCAGAAGDGVAKSEKTTNSLPKTVVISLVTSLLDSTRDPCVYKSKPPPRCVRPRGAVVGAAVGGLVMAHVPAAPAGAVAELLDGAACAAGDTPPAFDQAEQRHDRGDEGGAADDDADDGADAPEGD